MPIMSEPARALRELGEHVVAELGGAEPVLGARRRQRRLSESRRVLREQRPEDAEEDDRRRR